MGIFYHPLTGVGILSLAYAVFNTLYYLDAEPADRAIALYLAGLFGRIGGFLILLGVVVQGFRRLERLIVYRDMDIVEARGLAGNLMDSPGVKKTYLKRERDTDPGVRLRDRQA